MSEELGIKSRKADFGQWYLEILEKAQIMDQRYPVKGFPVYMPWAIFIIKKIYESLETELEATDHQPVSFPVVIPEKNLEKEKEHVKGFENEVFWINFAGKNKLEERLFLRPTSETAIYPMFSLWVRSYRDLPLKVYQSVQVYRYETKMTKPLMRGREFFWIETHTAQKTMDEATKQVEEDVKIMSKLLNDTLGIPFLLIERPEWDKFPGAEYTYAYDTLIPDGRSLQVATTHNLGQKFSKPFDIKFLKDDGSYEYIYQTCFGPGVSRLLAALISVHGDDKGLIMPPNIAPVQIVIIPIVKKGEEKTVDEKCLLIEKTLKKYFRVHYDRREHRPGFKFNEWEMKGVPLRIEIGPNDIKKGSVVLVRRDDGQKIEIKEKDLAEKITEILEDIFIALKKRSEKTFRSSITEVRNMKELAKKMEDGGFAVGGICSLSSKGEKCAEQIEKETSAKVRGKIHNKNKKSKCIVCEKEGVEVYFARAY